MLKQTNTQTELERFYGYQKVHSNLIGGTTWTLLCLLGLNGFIELEAEPAGRQTLMGTGPEVNRSSNGEQ